MPMRIIVCVPGSEVDRWRRAARGAFDVIKATTWTEALAEARIDVGFVFFHLAERLGLQPTNHQSETLYLVATLALMRACEIWPILSARPDALADPTLRTLLMKPSP